MNLKAKIHLTDHTLIEYVRDKKRRPVGVFVADKVPNEDGTTYSVSIGWSRCNWRDKFHKETGLSIAFGRLCKNRIENVPHSMKTQFYKFLERCERYYKMEFSNNPIIQSLGFDLKELRLSSTTYISG